MRKEIVEILGSKEETKELAELRLRLQGLVRMSRQTMADYHPIWDKNDKVYRGERVIDVVDKQAIQKGEPAKVFVPLTHTQVQTFVSFGTTLITGRDYIFELSGSGIEDVRPAKLAQAVVQRDLEHNKFAGVLLPQFLTDLARFGVGVFKTQWRRETCPYQVEIPDPKWKPVPNLPTQQVPPTITSWEEKTKYLGNMIEVVSPYRWFPDTRLPLTRYRYGEFCADENEYSMPELRKMQDQGEVSGLDHISRLPDDAFTDRKLNSINQETNSRFDPTISAKEQEHFVLITEVEIKLNPSKTLIAEGVALDPTCDHDIVYFVWIANDSRIISVRDSGYDHNEFLYDVSQFFNDQNRLVNFGIAELLGPMQDTIDFLHNSRITNVRKVMQNFFVVDPRNINLQDMADRNPVIRLNSTVPEGTSIDMYIKQLSTTDVTTGHITDMALVKDMAQDCTGLNDNLMGEYHQGRRSAREVSNVNANASARVIVPLKGIWQSALLPLANKMLSNHRQGLDEEQLVRIIGIQRYLEQRDAVGAFLMMDKSQLIGSYDFLVFEATLPSQRMAIAAALAQAGDILIKNPQAILALQLDPKLLFDEWLELQGVSNAERFRLTPQRLAEIISMAQFARNAGGAQSPQRPGQEGGQPSQGVAA